MAKSADQRFHDLMGRGVNQLGSWNILINNCLNIINIYYICKGLKMNKHGIYQ